MSDQPNRLHYLDALRSTLMMLGVVLHSAQIYNPSQLWYIHADQASATFGAIADFIHLFRMPAFFTLSGYFCALTLHRYGARRFCQVRLVRIAVPLLVTAVTLNSVQAVVLHYSGWRLFDLSVYLSEGQWVTHLWFLLQLIVYFVVAALVWVCFPTLATRAGRWAGQQLQRLPVWVLMLVLPVSAVLVLALNKTGFPLYSYSLWNTLSTYGLVRQFPYFLFGILLFVDRSLFERFVTMSPRLMAALVIFPLSIVVLLAGRGGGLALMVSLYAQAVLVWALVAVCFTAFRVLCDRPSSLWRSLSDASYTVYLFHHLTVMVLGLIVLRLALPAVAAVPLLIAVTLCITLSLHFGVIARYRWTSLLFNGKFPRVDAPGSATGSRISSQQPTARSSRPATPLSPQRYSTATEIGTSGSSDGAGLSQPEMPELPQPDRQ